MVQILTRQHKNIYTMANDIKETEYPVLEPLYLKFNSSLIKGKHKDLPNAYYQYHQETIKQRTDYTHPTTDVIRSVIREYGAFSSLTEKELEKMINSGTDDIMEVDTEQASNEFTDPQDCVEINTEMEFYKKRDELLKYVRKALGASTLSLDFVSLLISSVRPAAGSSSMSPHLKQSIKLGSLSCDKINPSIPNKEEHENQKSKKTARVGHGWKVQGLQKASAFIKFLVALMRQDLEKEKTYWKEVTDVLNAHELITTAVVPVDTVRPSKSVAPPQGSKSLQKPKQKRVLAVKYGYGDSGSQYFDSGLALLEKGKSGHLEFEKFNANDREKTWRGENIVSVKLYQKSLSNTKEPKLIGQSNSYKTLKEDLITDNNSVVSKIKNSRFFIFENELFWHLMKEASSLISHRIQVVGSVIRIELFDKIIHIENINVDDESIQQPLPKLEEDVKANNILLFFKILLCANNLKNMEKQHVPPVAMDPVANMSRLSKNAILIRPIIMYTEHNRMIDKFRRVLTKLLMDLGVEGVEANCIINQELIIKRIVNNPNELQQFKTCKRCYNNDPFLKVHSKMAPTSLIILKHSSMKIWIELISNYSTLHISMNVRVINLESKDVLLESTFMSKRDVYSCLLWILKESR